jgi:hypothetical protein
MRCVASIQEKRDIANAGLTESVRQNSSHHPREKLKICTITSVPACLDLISDAPPFGRLWYGEPDAISNAIGYCFKAGHMAR